MTIAIASHQRRALLMRLLRSLDRELVADEALREDLDIHVVLDGCTDGSAEAVRSATWSVPVVVHEKSSGGLASARNVGLDAAAGRLVWFLDDDLIAEPGLVRRHRSSHRPEAPRLVVGVCRIPDDEQVPAPLRAWWDEFHADLAAAGRVERFDQFTAANTSGPAELLSGVGGFDESFVAYGFEDYELAVRLLEAGVSLDHDPGAVAWHPSIPPQGVLIARQRDLGENAARLVDLHPSLLDAMFPPIKARMPHRLIRRTRLRSPRGLMAISYLGRGLVALTNDRVDRVARHAERVARVAARGAGVATIDPSGELLDRVLGQPRVPSASRPRRRSSRQPENSP